MQKMKLGMQFDPSGGFHEAVERVAALEQVGLDVVWVPEAYAFDAVSAMGYLAARTQRLQIGSGILSIYSRTPALLAQTAAGVDRVSNGRAILGLGASGPQVIEGWHGLPYDRPLQRTREVVDVCRLVWRREHLAYRGACITLPLPPERGTGLGKPIRLSAHPLRERVPIYLAALGPRNVELAAEIAEGWMPIYFIPERAQKVWGEALARGAARRDPALGPLEVVTGVPVAIGEGLEHLREAARTRVAFYTGGMGARGANFYNNLMRRCGFEREAELIQDLYLAGKKEEAAAAVPAELLERTSLIGPAGYIKERLAAYQAAGVTVLNVNPLVPDSVGTVAQLREFIEAL